MNIDDAEEVHPESCCTCRHFMAYRDQKATVFDAGKRGECRRSPPMHTVLNLNRKTETAFNIEAGDKADVSEVEFVWPRVNDDSWCSDWAAPKDD